MSDDSPLELTSGAALGRYELLLPIAKGGMAQVWAARLHGTRGFQKLVAIKTILSGAIDNTRMEQMFLEEAYLASQIHHSNVVTTIDLGEHAGTLYLVMEWVDGEPLNAVISKAAASGGVPLPIAVNLIGQACKGLYAAHTLRDENGAPLGVVHRDVSPQNLLVTFSGTAKLVDFGIAKATSRVSGLTEAGEVKGKFAFMAPEQVRGHAVDARTDLFALGILLYQITTGKHPFRGSHPAETIQNICAERGPTPPSAFLPDYPASLEEVVLKALAKDPEQRFATANEMLTALEDAMPGPLEASFEVEVAEYLKQLFGPRASERRAALRAAQEMLDRQRGESGISAGTLRAIAIDQGDSPSMRSSSWGTPPPAPAIVPWAPAVVAATSPAKISRRKLFALGGAGSVLALALLAQFARNPAGGGGHAAASSPVPMASFVLPAAPIVSPVVSAPASSAKASEPDPDEHKSDKHSSRDHKGVRGIRPIAAGSAGQAATVTSAPPAAAAPSSAAAPATTQSASAWDRGAFGGRH
jgi:serine/threonine-protein kinase